MDCHVIHLTSIAALSCILQDCSIFTTLCWASHLWSRIINRITGKRYFRWHIGEWKPWSDLEQVCSVQLEPHRVWRCGSRRNDFYPRPVLAFGYCRCLRVCVCVCVRVSVNHEIVRAIIHQPFKLGSPNLDRRCKRPCWRSLLFCGVIDGDLQGQIELKSQHLPHFGLVSLSGR